MKACNCFGTGDKWDNGCVVLFALLSRQCLLHGILTPEEAEARVRGDSPSSSPIMYLSVLKPSKLFGRFDCLPHPLLVTEWKLAEEEGKASQEAPFSPVARVSLWIPGQMSCAGPWECLIKD